MSKSGNHGQVIPRDHDLLFRLYWIDRKTLPEMGRLFGTTHNSVMHVMNELGIPRRRMGPRAYERCITCRLAEPYKVPHKLTKNGTGTRCQQCLRMYKRDWQRRKTAMDPSVREKRKAEMKRWYEEGPLNPKGERQWISKSKALLRSTKRLLKKRMTSPGASQSRSVASAPGQTSPT